MLMMALHWPDVPVIQSVGHACLFANGVGASPGTTPQPPPPPVYGSWLTMGQGFFEGTSGPNLPPAQTASQQAESH